MYFPFFPSFFFLFCICWCKHQNGWRFVLRRSVFWLRAYIFCAGAAICVRINPSLHSSFHVVAVAAVAAASTRKRKRRALLSANQKSLNFFLALFNQVNGSSSREELPSRAYIVWLDRDGSRDPEDFLISFPSFFLLLSFSAECEKAPLSMYTDKKQKLFP